MVSSSVPLRARPLLHHTRIVHHEVPYYSIEVKKKWSVISSSAVKVKSQSLHYTLVTRTWEGMMNAEMGSSSWQCYSQLQKICTHHSPRGRAGADLSDVRAICETSEGTVGRDIRECGGSVRLLVQEMFCWAVQSIWTNEGIDWRDCWETESFLLKKPFVSAGKQRTNKRFRANAEKLVFSFSIVEILEEEIDVRSISSLWQLYSLSTPGHPGWRIHLFITHTFFSHRSDCRESTRNEETDSSHRQALGRKSLCILSSSQALLDLVRSLNDERRDMTM